MTTECNGQMPWTTWETFIFFWKEKSKDKTGLITPILL